MEITEKFPECTLTFGSCSIVVKTFYSNILIITCSKTSNSYTSLRGSGNTEKATPFKGDNVNSSIKTSNFETFVLYFSKKKLKITIIVVFFPRGRLLVNCVPMREQRTTKITLNSVFDILKLIPFSLFPVKT